MRAAIAEATRAGLCALAKPLDRSLARPASLTSRGLFISLLQRFLIIHD